MLTAAIAGCGSGSRGRTAGPSHSERAAARRLLERRAQTTDVEVSDLSPQTSCREWLSTSPTARDVYLQRNWPHLPAIEALRVVHDQNLSCQVAPPHEGAPHASMEALQPAVDVVVWGLAVFYEETVAVGIRESVQEYLERVSGHPRHRPSTG
jgi:hypothetical protein